jgi:hypothetical protein
MDDRFSDHSAVLNKMNEKTLELVAKVPQVTFVFWITKILATTLGETAATQGVGATISHAQAAREQRAPIGVIAPSQRTLINAVTFKAPLKMTIPAMT